MLRNHVANFVHALDFFVLSFSQPFSYRASFSELMKAG